MDYESLLNKHNTMINYKKKIYKDQSWTLLNLICDYVDIESHVVYFQNESNKRARIMDNNKMSVFFTKIYVMIGFLNRKLLLY